MLCAAACVAAAGSFLHQSSSRVSSDAPVPSLPPQGPLMLEMGVLADVAAATSATMIMFTAASASAVYASFGTVK